MGLDADRIRVLPGSAPPTTIAPQVFARFQIMAYVYLFTCIETDG